MTTIAVTATEIAWDSQSTRGNIRGIAATEKVFAIAGHIYACCGEADACEVAPYWHADGADPRKLPKGDWGMLVINEVGIRFYGRDCPNGYFLAYPQAIGSGNEYALTAMMLGKTALQAVEVAAAIDIYTGGPFKSMKLKDVFKAHKAEQARQQKGVEKVLETVGEDPAEAVKKQTARRKGVKKAVVKKTAKAGSVA